MTELKYLEGFAKFIKSKGVIWEGIDAMNTMLKAKDSNALQGEWQGFYFEYLLKEYQKTVNENHSYVKNSIHKQNNDLDFDVEFNIGKKNFFYGDLKTKGKQEGKVDKTLILNESKTMDIAFEQHGKLWFIVLFGDVILDKTANDDYKTTKHWNKLLKKDKEMSYSNKMKKSFKPTSFKIIEITNSNKEYIKIMKQGKNGNGKARNTKYSTSVDDFDKTVIFNFNY